MEGLGNDYIFVDTRKCNFPAALEEKLSNPEVGFKILRCIQYLTYYNNACRKFEPRKVIKRLSKRHTGIGGDGVVILKWNINSSMLEMRMFNADGTEALMCGNAIRCIGAYHFEGHPTETELNILTGAGIRRLKQALHGEIEASMGELKILKTDKGSVSEKLTITFK